MSYRRRWGIAHLLDPACGSVDKHWIINEGKEIQ